MKTKTKAADDLRDISAAIDAKRTECQSKWQALEAKKAEAKSLGAELFTNEDAFNALDEVSKDYDASVDELNAMQVKHARIVEMFSEEGPAPGQPTRVSLPEGKFTPRAISERFLDSETYSALKKLGALESSRVRIGNTPSFEAIRKDEFRAATLVKEDYPSTEFRRDGIVGLPLAPYTILDLISTIPTDKDVIEYVYEKTFTNTAVETGEVDEAPEGVVDFDVAQVSCVEIPFWIPSSRQVLSDEPRLRAWIEKRLVDGVKTRLQKQIISGAGDGDNMTGILYTANILTQDQGAYGKFESVHRAKTKIFVQTDMESTANCLLIHPTDYEELVLEMDANDRYYFGGPASDGLGTIWGLRPVQHTAVPQGNPIVCDITQAELYVRDNVMVSVSDSHDDYFIRRMLAWLATGRWALVVPRPAAFCQIADFDS